MTDKVTIKQIYDYVKKLGLENMPVEFHTDDDIFTLDQKQLNRYRVYGQSRTYLDDFSSKIVKDESLKIELS